MLDPKSPLASRDDVSTAKRTSAIGGKFLIATVVLAITLVKTLMIAGEFLLLSALAYAAVDTPDAPAVAGLALAASVIRKGMSLVHSAYHLLHDWRIFLAAGRGVLKAIRRTSNTVWRLHVKYFDRRSRDPCFPHL